MTNQLPQWAIDAGWTDADRANGWYVAHDWEMAHVLPVDQHDGVLKVSTDKFGAVWLDDTMRDSAVICVVPDTSPAAARQCALEFVAAINRARGEQDVPTYTTPFGTIYGDGDGKFVVGSTIYDTFPEAAIAIEARGEE